MMLTHGTAVLPGRTRPAPGHRPGRAGRVSHGGGPSRTRHSCVRPLAALEVAQEAVAAPVGIYAILGASAASFAGTFFVAPFWRKNFKEEEKYEDIYAALCAKGVQFVPPRESAKRRGAVLLDVRLTDAVARERIPQAVAAPLYRLIEGFSPFAIIRRAAFAFFAIPGTERNPEWLEQVAAAVKGNKGAELIVVCERGGSLVNKPGMSLGFQSRSLKAVYLLRQAGFRNVRVMEGGMYGWGQADLPVVSDE